MRAFDMSRYQRVIATEGDVRGSFVIYGSPGGIFKAEVLDLTLWDEERRWGRIIRSGEFSIRVEDGVLTVGKDRHPDKVHDIDEFEDRINETLVLVVAAFNGGPGSVVDSEASDSRECDRGPCYLGAGHEGECKPGPSIRPKPGGSES